jgi:malate dehydrogenase (oxaloacetate-decarboxylating)
MSINEEALAAHAKWAGKLNIDPKMDIETRYDLSVCYTPGVAEPCLKIADNPEDAWVYTAKQNTVAVITDGSAVLGLGNIGAAAAQPVMEGKCALFKRFAGVNAFPICLDTQDVDEIVDTCIKIAPVFGGINLEDISAPRCFEVERRLNEALDIPVFHDDQHGTAIVVLSALINSLKLVGKEAATARVVINGAGAAGCAIAYLLLAYGFKNITMCGLGGKLWSGHELINDAQRELLQYTNKDDAPGTLAEALVDADIFVGVSAGNLVTAAMVEQMAEKPIVFAMANPTPEIFPEEAKKGGAYVVGTGRSDYPNQINNVIAFPGIFKGALAARASKITQEMELAAARALASLVSDDKLSPDFVMPDPFDPRVADVVAGAVEMCARGEQASN